MTFGIKGHPDMLRRFVAAPFVFSLIIERKNIRIESNDIEIALNLRRYVSSPSNTYNTVLLWRIIRDESSLGRGFDDTLIDDEFLRTLSAGGTILAYDKNKSEVIGFLAYNVSAELLIGSMLFILIEKNHNIGNGFYEKKTNEVLLYDN